MKTRIIAFVMTVVVLIGSGVVNKYETVYAATESQNKGFTIDENVYNVNWEETGKIKVYGSSKGTKGFYLGYVNVQTGSATTKKPVDGYYYQRILVKADMCPQIISGTMRGMSQYLTLELKNEKDMKNLAIEPRASIGSTTYNVSTTHMVGGNIKVNKSKDGFTASGGGSYSLSIGASCSYTEDSLVISTNQDSNGYGRWDFDYVSSGYSKKQNAYLFSGTVQRGLYSWNMPKNYNGFYTSTKLYVTATFGMGDCGTNERLSYNGSYNIGSKTTNKKLIWD